MPSICFYFQVHQPERLRRFNIFQPPPGYFDDQQNAEILRKVATKCYLPCNRLLLKLIKKHQGRFKVAFSVTGAVIDQFQRFAPEALQSFQDLAATNCVEFLCETYHHSLSFLYSREEWAEQVEMHRALVQTHFGQNPTVFRNTELIYSNELAAEAQRLGFTATLCDGPSYAIFGRSAANVYVPPDLPDMRLLLKHSRLSDDIAFRFSNRNWPAWPLMADKYARWVYDTAGKGGCINLFMDYETFGEHQWAETGIFDFLEWLPVEFLKLPDATFMTPSEAANRRPAGEYDVPHMTSWADSERDLSAWLGNAMQSSALYELFAIEDQVKAAAAREGELLREGDPGAPGEPSGDREHSVRTSGPTAPAAKAPPAKSFMGKRLASAKTSPAPADTALARTPADTALAKTPATAARAPAPAGIANPPASSPPADANLLQTWRRLQISDHFYYMSTKYHADAIVHRYFNPYDTPYDAFINFMNVLDDFKARLGVAPASSR